MKRKEPALVVRLEESIFGFELVYQRGNRDVLAEIYGHKDAETFEAEGEVKRYFGKDLSLSEALARATRITRKKGFRVSVCGSRERNPVLRVFAVAPDNPGEIEDINVDLKWGLWLSLPGDWESYAPGVWGRMDKAFSGEGPAVRIRTAPRKEILYGDVIISRRKVSVDFLARWDSPDDLVPDWVPQDKFEDFEEMIAEWFVEGTGYYEEYTDPIGARVQETLTGRKWATMARKIDALQEQLSRQEREHSKAFSEACLGFAEVLGIKPGQDP
ncbi:hypothetical protein [Thioalkalivibrio thiocyanodenitrificans]|uniref:hypothetical protein n=1 Tax=Thioalkalivibrio thiocyanodenitrificans TaxID=243063 RepID=UPI0012E9EEEB|nr:hypothetical protein [Thioalkalivibrio thiocyanodenitrificans]